MSWPKRPNWSCLDLARAQRAAGHEEQARESLAGALALFEELNADAEAVAVRSTLAAQDNLGTSTTLLARSYAGLSWHHE